MSKLITKLKTIDFSFYFSLIALSCFVALSVAFFAEYILNIKPCNLCKIERYPYLLIILSSIIGVIYKKQRLLLFIININLLLIEIIISIYHVGIERGIFKLSKLCQMDSLNDKNMSASEILTQINLVDAPPCDIPIYLIDKISIAEMNLIFALCLFLYSLNYIKKKLVI